MNSKDLGSSAYVVLGLTLQHVEITPYELKQRIATSVGYFWAYSHPQIYSVTERLRSEGFLSQRREQTGRRRKIYKVTKSGEEAFRSWLANPDNAHPELRDTGLLKLYFGNFSSKQDVQALATAQLNSHKTRLELYKSIPKERKLDEFALKTVQLGIDFEKMSEKYWAKVVADFTD
jgi:PadR family transcriptional regulator AphA